MATSALALVRHPHQRKVREKISPLGLVAPPEIDVECTSFSGSLSNLFGLVRDHRIDLRGVPLAPICVAYFEYVLRSSLTSVDEAAAAVAALSYLLERKAWALLPVPDPEPELEEVFELLAPSISEFEQAIQALDYWKQEREHLFFRKREGDAVNYELPIDLGEVTSADLAIALEKLLAKAQLEPIEPLAKPRRALSDQMAIVLRTMTSQWVCLAELVPQPFSRSEGVWWFLAILELIRLGQVSAKLDEGDVRFARTH